MPLRWLLLLLLLLLAQRARGVVRQGAREWPNSDFFVSFAAFNVTGSLRLGAFDAAAPCTFDTAGFDGTAVVVVRFSDIAASGCFSGGGAFDKFARTQRDALAAGVPAALPALFVAVDDTADNEYADLWSKTDAERALPVGFTSIRRSVLAELDFNATVTITSATSVWQTTYLAPAYYGYGVTLAVIWALSVALFLAALAVDGTALVRQGTQQRAALMRAALALCGFLYSMIMLSINAARAWLWVQRDVLLINVEQSLIAAALFVLITGAVVVGNMWLHVCLETCKLSPLVVRTSRIAIAVAWTAATIVIFIYIAASFGAVNGQGPRTVLMLFLILSVSALCIAVIILVCFFKIWFSIQTGVLRSNRRRLWKLAFLSIASAFNMIMLTVCLLCGSLTVSSVSAFVAVNVLIVLAPLPVLVGWITVSTLWETLLVSLGLVTASSVSDETDTDGRASRHSIELKRTGSSSAKLKLSRVASAETADVAQQATDDGVPPGPTDPPRTYRVGELEVEL